MTWLPWRYSSIFLDIQLPGPLAGQKSQTVHVLCITYINMWHIWRVPAGWAALHLWYSLILRVLRQADASEQYKSQCEKWPMAHAKQTCQRGSYLLIWSYQSWLQSVLATPACPGLDKTMLFKKRLISCPHVLSPKCQRWALYVRHEQFSGFCYCSWSSALPQWFFSWLCIVFFCNYIVILSNILA